MSLFSDCPTWLDEEAWQAYCDWRKSLPKKQRMTDYARNLILMTLAKLREQGQDPTLVVQQSLRNCWLDMYPVKAAKPSYQELPASNEARIPATFSFPERPSQEESRAGYERVKAKLEEVKLKVRA